MESRESILGWNSIKDYVNEHGSNKTVNQCKKTK